MESVFYSVSLALFFLSVLAMLTIVRDVLPLMSQEERNLLHNFWIGPVGLRALINRDRAIRKAWNEHVRAFPKSRKRVLFASSVIASAISLMGYPLWLVFGLR